MYAKGREIVVKCASKVGRSDIVDYLNHEPSTVRVHTSCYVKFTVNAVQLSVDEEDEVLAEAPPV